MVMDDNDELVETIAQENGGGTMEVGETSESVPAPETTESDLVLQDDDRENSLEQLTEQAMEVEELSLTENITNDATLNEVVEPLAEKSEDDLQVNINNEEMSNNIIDKLEQLPETYTVASTIDESLSTIASNIVSEPTTDILQEAAKNIEPNKWKPKSGAFSLGVPGLTFSAQNLKIANDGTKMVQIHQSQITPSQLEALQANPNIKVVFRHIPSGKSFTKPPKNLFSNKTVSKRKAVQDNAAADDSVYNFDDFDDSEQHQNLPPKVKPHNNGSTKFARYNPNVGFKRKQSRPKMQDSGLIGDGMHSKPILPTQIQLTDALVKLNKPGASHTIKVHVKQVTHDILINMELNPKYNIVLTAKHEAAPDHSLEELVKEWEEKETLDKPQQEAVQPLPEPEVSSEPVQSPKATSEPPVEESPTIAEVMETASRSPEKTKPEKAIEPTKKKDQSKSQIRVKEEIDDIELAAAVLETTSRSGRKRKPTRFSLEIAKLTKRYSTPLDEDTPAPKKARVQSPAKDDRVKKSGSDDGTKKRGRGRPMLKKKGADDVTSNMEEKEESGQKSHPNSLRTEPRVMLSPADKRMADKKLFGKDAKATVAPEADSPIQEIMEIAEVQAPLPVEKLPEVREIAEVREDSSAVGEKELPAEESQHEVSIQFEKLAQEAENQGETKEVSEEKSKISEEEPKISEEEPKISEEEPKISEEEPKTVDESEKVTDEEPKETGEDEQKQSSTDPTVETVTPDDSSSPDKPQLTDDTLEKVSSDSTEKTPEKSIETATDKQADVEQTKSPVTLSSTTVADESPSDVLARKLSKETEPVDSSNVSSEKADVEPTSSLKDFVEEEGDVDNKYRLRKLLQQCSIDEIRSVAIPKALDVISLGDFFLQKSGQLSSRKSSFTSLYNQLEDLYTFMEKESLRYSTLLRRANKVGGDKRMEKVILMPVYNKSAADSLGISSSSVDAHIGGIYQKPTAPMIAANSFHMNCRMDPPVHRLKLPDISDKMYGRKKVSATGLPPTTTISSQQAHLNALTAQRSYGAGRPRGSYKRNYQVRKPNYVLGGETDRGSLSLQEHARLQAANRYQPTLRQNVTLVDTPATTNYQATPKADSTTEVKAVLTQAIATESVQLTTAAAASDVGDQTAGEATEETAAIVSAEDGKQLVSIGDGQYVELPEGYTLIQTEDGYIIGQPGATFVQGEDGNVYMTSTEEGGAEMTDQVLTTTADVGGAQTEETPIEQLTQT